MQYFNSRVYLIERVHDKLHATQHDYFFWRVLQGQLNSSKNSCLGVSKSDNFIDITAKKV